MSATLEGHRVLVTGGATGIGAAISHALIAAGARVAVAQPTAENLAASLDGAGLAGRVEGIVADLSRHGAPDAAVGEAIQRLGGLDALVNNAAVTGPPAHKPVLDIDEAHVDLMVDVNLKAAVLCSVAAARHMVEAGHGGAIVSTSSVLAHTAGSGSSVYSATKAALFGFTKGAARELGPHGVRVLTVSPGDIATAASVAPPAPPGQRAVRDAALGRRGRPEEIGAVVRFLIGPDAGYLTGTDVLVDGGFLLT